MHNDAAAPVCTVHGSAGFAMLLDASAIKKPVRFARCARRWERISPNAWGTLRLQVHLVSHLGSGFRA